MPIISPDNMENAPASCKIAAWGITRFKKGDDPGVELHFHDGDELWFVIEGKIRVRSEEKEYVISRGQALFTECGDQHEMLEVMEDTVMLWVEQDMRGRGRMGHLHHPEDPWP